MYKKSIIVFLTMLSLSSSIAQDFSLKQLHVRHPFARPTIEGASSGVAYLTVENSGHEADSLIKITSPIALSVALHSMTTDNGIMRMREVPALTILPGQKWVMDPHSHDGHGYHVMLMNLAKPLKKAESFPMNLTFKKSGTLKVQVKIE